MNNHMQNKCFIASAGGHLLLASILVFGPAFLPSGGKIEDVKPIKFLPSRTVDTDEQGGGTPGGGSPPPPARAIPPTPPRRVPPTPAADPVPPTQARALDPAPQPRQTQRRLPDVPTVASSMPRNRPDPQAAARALADQRAREARAAEQRAQEIARAFGSASTGISRAVSSSTAIHFDAEDGPGGGGPAYANFLSAVKAYYEEAWLVPPGIADDNATTGASVTIARDGTILKAKITRFSGNRDVDRSVQDALDRVTKVAPLPSTATEDQRTVDINFNVKAKRGLG